MTKHHSIVNFTRHAAAVPRPAEAAPEPGLQRAYERLIEGCIALSAEQDHNRLLESVLTRAMDMTGADAGVLYLLHGRALLQAEIVHIRSRAVVLGGPSGSAPPALPAVALYNPISGEPNYADAASCVAHGGGGTWMASGREDIPLDTAGPDAAAKTHDYRALSCLGLPLVKPDGEVGGVLQLMNALDAGGQPAPFEPRLRPIVEALASQVSVALENQVLIQNQRDLFDALVRMIATAIDAKSPYTSGHCQRVPVICEMLADAACATETGPFADFDLNAKERDEWRLAAWLHDCGKVATPEHIVDKATKLETLRDGIHEIGMRFEVVKREVEIETLKRIVEDPANKAEHRAEMYDRLRELDEDFAFLARINKGDLFMTDAMVERVEDIAAIRLRDSSGVAVPLIGPEELENLSIREGTLNARERAVVRRHVEVSVAMLDQLPFPKELRQVAEIVGAHHEKIDGSGYPNGLIGDQISLAQRMLAIADIFEALTAGDRPYKKANTLREALEIMAAMRDAGKIDGDLFDLFLSSQVWRDYADKHMPAELRDGVHIDALLRRSVNFSKESTMFAATG